LERTQGAPLNWRVIGIGRLAAAYGRGDAMEKYIAQMLFVVGLAVWLGWVLVRRMLAVDLERRKSESGEPPTETQLRHYIKSMREDISLLTVTNFAVLLVLIFALVLKL
jgi:hypothetical protein